MNLREALLEEHSKEQCSRILQWIDSDQERFDQLVSIFLNDEYRIIQRASWPLSYAVEQHPEFAVQHMDAFVECLNDATKHPAVKRNILRLLPHVNIPEHLEGIVIDSCFQFISDPKEAAAPKAFSLTILDQLALKYPELQHELLLIIEDRYNNESAAFKSRAKKILQRSKSQKGKSQ